MKVRTRSIKQSLFVLIALFQICLPLLVSAEARTQNPTALTCLEDVCPGVEIDLKYATDDNFTRHVVYPTERAFLVEPAARALASAQAELQKSGFGIRVLDAYRPLSVQREFWKLVPDSRYVASPQQGSRHNRGASVDVTLIDNRGNECEMPTVFDDFSERAGAFFPGATIAARRNRQILQKAMTRNGFKILESEWWHFDFGDWKEHPLLDTPLEEVRRSEKTASGGEEMTDWRLDSTTLQSFFSSLDHKGIGQIVLVMNMSAFEPSAMVQFFEKKGQEWVRTLTSRLASIGRNGIAAPGEKREGDGKSPGGMFPIGIAFGYEVATPTRMPYVLVTEDDVWVDDPKAPDYNRLVKKSDTRSASYETMRREDDLYKFGLLVEYNTSPVVAGNGSAIFIHLWAASDKPTAGCVAFSEERMKAVLSWLDPAKKPHIAIGTRSTLFPLP